MFTYFTKKATRYKRLDFLGFPNNRVGDDGSVWIRNSRSGWLWKRLKMIRDEDGRSRVSLSYNGKQKQWLVHRLVLTAFVGFCPKGMEACHFPDRNPANNNLSNLRWDHHVNNEKDKEFHGTTNHGERNGMAKLTNENIREIRRLRIRGWKQKDIAEKFGIGDGKVSCILSGKLYGKVM